MQCFLLFLSNLNCQEQSVTMQLTEKKNMDFFLRSCFGLTSLSSQYGISIDMKGLLIPYNFFPFPHLVQPPPQTAFIKVSLAACSSSLKIVGLPTVVRNTDPAHIFV